MHRRRFLQNLGLLGLAGTASFALPAYAAASERSAKWAPSGKKPSNTSQPVVAEWRYLAGTCTNGNKPYGFVVSLGMVRTIENPTEETYQLLVEKIDLASGENFVHAVYDGMRTYEPSIDRYIFTAENDVSLVWDWVETSGVYRLDLSTPELRFYDVVLRPCGDLIAEGGTGIIDVGEINVGDEALVMGSTYHADWVQLEMGGQLLEGSIARLDMQSLYPTGERATGGGDYDHNWFALSGDVEGEPVYISAWRIESTRGPRWDVTIARTIDGAWTAQSFTHDDRAVQPLQVTPLSFQPIPGPPSPALGSNQTGASWQLQAGTTKPSDLLDITLAVPPGQFISGARVGQLQGTLMEAIGTEASGTIQGLPLTNVCLVVAESTFETTPGKVFVPLAAAS